MDRPIKVRDFRNKQFFMIDDAYLNGYARHLGVSASMVYICLCRHADKEQVAFPSQESIANKLGIKKRTVLEKIKLLRKWGLVEVKQTRNKNGIWINNTYILLDKSEWKRIPSVEKQHTELPSVEKLRSPSAVLQHNKDTHIKETHISTVKHKKYSSLKDISETDFIEISEKYKVSVGFVKLQFEKLVNYCEAKGRRYKNYKSALRNFVLGDMQRNIERRNDGKYRPVDARGL